MSRISNPPSAEALMIGARSIGNYDLAAALGDLIDNSITANANTVSITCNFNEADPFIIVKDNGEGMDHEQLINAMRPASANPQETREANDLGRFGWGLKSASFSQARKLIVASKKNNTLSLAIWDLDNIKNFEMEIFKKTDAKLILEEYGSSLQSDGTIVIWGKCDRLTDANELSQAGFNQKVMDAKNQLELIFHQFLDGSRKKKLTVYLNSQALEGYDPFLASHPATQSFHTESIDILNLGTMHVTPYVLPHYSKLDRLTISSIEGSEGLVRNQGFYVYRNERLIIHGTWFGIFKYGELSDLVRVKIEIPNTMDHIWQISIDKKDAKLPQYLKFRLKKLLSSIHTKSKRVYKRRSSNITSGDNSNVWSRVKKNGKTKFELSRDSEIVQSVSQAIPKEEHYKFEFLLKYIEQMLPVSGIIALETGDASDLIQNETNSLEANRLGRHLVELMYNGFEGEISDFRSKVLSTSYFLTQKKLGNEILNDFFEEISQ